MFSIEPRPHVDGRQTMKIVKYTPHHLQLLKGVFFWCLVEFGEEEESANNDDGRKERKKDKEREKDIYILWIENRDEAT